jgi:hypothetical protein
MPKQEQPAAQAPDAAPPPVISGSDQAANEAVPPDQRTPTAGQAPPPPPASQTLEQRQQAGTGGEDLSARAADLERELAEVRAKAAGGNTVRMRVEEPHAEFYHGGVGIGTDWTAVPAHMVPALTEAAGGAGVTLTQEETES